MWVLWMLLYLMLCAVSSTGYRVVACDNDLGLSRFVNEVNVIGKVYAEWEARMLQNHVNKRLL